MPGRTDRPTILLVHPPIHDFSAFDLFLYPLGLLEVGAAFERAGFCVELVDALDRFVPLPESGSPLKKPTFRKDGCGHFPRQETAPPPQLEEIPRRFWRFGLPRDLLKRKMKEAAPRPVLVGVTSAMTYWYLGAREVAEIARELYGKTPVVLGGAYATLCPDHARQQVDADLVVQGGDLDPLFDLLGPAGREKSPLKECGPAHHLVGSRDSAALRASRGCPYGCTYCAAALLSGPYRQREPGEVVEEIAFLVESRGCGHVAFHDDALVLPKAGFFLDLAARIRSRGLHERARFYCINGINAAAVSGSVAEALRKTGFTAIRLGFETASRELQATTGGKVTGDELAAALDRLYTAGFSPRDVAAYVLAGLPGQEAASVEETVRFVHSRGGQVRLSEYSPVPGTPDFEKARQLSRLDLAEPLFHNKTLAPYRFETLTGRDIKDLKDLVRRLNGRLLEKA